MNTPLPTDPKDLEQVAVSGDLVGKHVIGPDLIRPVLVKGFLVLKRYGATGTEPEVMVRVHVGENSWLVPDGMEVVDA